LSTIKSYTLETSSKGFSRILDLNNISLADSDEDKFL
jgi:hypothetical protein